jgi:hypothetical protein
MSGRVQPRFICSRALVLFKIYLVHGAALFVVDRDSAAFSFSIRSRPPAPQNSTSLRAE